MNMMNMPKKANPFRTLGLGLSFLIALAAAPDKTADSEGLFLLQKPALSQTQIVFVFAGDLWSVPREGGEAERLTSSPGFETNPVFSPDGSKIAFTGEYDGNVDVFVMPAAGGVPRRLTWHPAADVALGWTPDGKRVLFTSGRNAYSRFSELYHGRPRRRPRGEAARCPWASRPPSLRTASASPTSPCPALLPPGSATAAARRHRSGSPTSPIPAIEKVPREDSNDFNPMWVGDKVYFLSDREGAVSLFAYDLEVEEGLPGIRERRPGPQVGLGRPRGHRL